MGTFFYIYNYSEALHNKVKKTRKRKTKKEKKRIRASTTDVTKKKCHFATPKTYFIILPHHFTIFHLLDILSFNSIH